MDIVRIVSEALRSQDQIQRRIPISRQTSIGLQLSDGFFRNQYTWDRLASYGRVLSVFVSRITLEIYWDYSTQVWQICPLPYPAGTITEDSNNRRDTVTVGPHTCSKYRITLDDVLDKTTEWVRNKTGTSQEHVITLVLNLNDLQSIGPPSAVSQQRPLSTSLSQALNKTQIIYTPWQLRRDRQSMVAINASTTNISNLTSPYFSFSPNTTNFDSSFPTPSQLLIRKIHLIPILGENRLPVSSTYNISQDLEVLFPSNMTTILRTDQLYPSQQITCARPGPNIAMNGTGFDVTEPRFSAQSPQSSDRIVSWNFVTIQDTVQRPLDGNLVSQLTRCGFSVQFTQNYTAELLNGTLWSWNYLEPNTDLKKGCTALSRNSTKWEADSCDNLAPIACQRIGQNPFDWLIQFPLVRFPNSSDVCTPPYQFGVPRTPQEQSSLIAALLASNASKVWVNLRRTSPSCWISSSNDTCPSLLDESLLVQQLIGSNLKQGIIILLILVFFLVYQCRAQYRLNKEYRRKMAVRRKVKAMQRHSIPRSKKHLK